EPFDGESATSARTRDDRRSSEFTGVGGTKRSGCFAGGEGAQRDAAERHIRELSSFRRLVISADGTLQQVPFELLEQPSANSRRLLDTHVVSYSPSAGILTMLRTRAGSPVAVRTALAVGASPEIAATGSNGSPSGPVTRGVYDLDATQLRPLPL